MNENKHSEILQLSCVYTYIKHNIIQGLLRIWHIKLRNYTIYGKIRKMYTKIKYVEL